MSPKPVAMPSAGASLLRDIFRRWRDVECPVCGQRDEHPVTHYCQVANESRPFFHKPCGQFFSKFRLIEHDCPAEVES